MAPENSIGAEKANVTACVELRLFVFSFWPLPTRHTEDMQNYDLEACTILVRFPLLDFSFEKDVDGQA